MVDYRADETVYVPYVHQSIPDALRCRFIRQDGKKLIVAGDHGTEQSFLIRYVFKSRDDAVEEAERMLHKKGGASEG